MLLYSRAIQAKLFDMILHQRLQQWPFQMVKWLQTVDTTTTATNMGRSHSIHAYYHPMEITENTTRFIIPKYLLICMLAGILFRGVGGSIKYYREPKRMLWIYIYEFIRLYNYYFAVIMLVGEK